MTKIKMKKLIKMELKQKKIFQMEIKMKKLKKKIKK